MDASGLKKLDDGQEIGKGAQTAWDMLSVEQSMHHITTSCEDLDTILGGGIHCGEVTEIGGVPGIGKTQLGIQLSVNVQIPYNCGGLCGKAIYIDTEGSFMVERAYQIAEACIADVLENDSEACFQGMSASNILENIFYFRVCSYSEQIAVINYLDKFLAEQKSVKIVVIDSIAFHFRQDFDDLALRTRVLSGMALRLMNLSKKFCLSVVLINQVTTKLTKGGSFQLTLALGESWSHSCTNRLILYWNGNERCARLDKSPYLPPASAPFSVSAKGIRGAASTRCKRVRMMM